MEGKTLHDIIIEMDHDIFVPEGYDPIDEIICAVWDINEQNTIKLEVGE